MEPKFGKLTLDELKKVYNVCAKDPLCCDRECPLYDSHKAEPCIEVLRESVLELIDSYNAIRELYEYWNEKARELNDKADKYEAVRGELINTQVRLRDVQNEFNAKLRALISAHEDVENLKSERKDLNVQIYEANAAKKRLETEITGLKDQLENGVNIIYRLTKEKNEANEELLHYHVLLGSLKAIGKAIFNDESRDHEKD